VVSKGGGNIILDHLEMDAGNPDNLFMLGNIGGFFIYSALFKHADKDGRWYGCDPADFGSAAAFTACQVRNDTILLFQNFFKSWFPNDTNNVFSRITGFYKDDVIPGGSTGDTAWHFKTETLNRDIGHYVSDCHFFDNSGPGYSVDMVGNINKTENGGMDWEQVYTGRDTLNGLCMISETDGYVVGNKGTVVKIGSPQGIRDEPVAGKPGFTVYPNSSSNWITISLKSGLRNVRIRILGRNGQEIMDFLLPGNRMELNICDLAIGIYYVVLNWGNKIEAVPVIRY
jgi:hypothetical protein